MDSNSHNGPLEETEAEIAELEAQLTAAKARWKIQKGEESGNDDGNVHSSASGMLAHRAYHHDALNAEPPLPPETHILILLSDSALPLGSFAFSSGLESYIAHTPRGRASFATFLPESVSSYASTTLPFVLAAWRDPRALPDLDDSLDAAIICAVGRRASVAQGRALMSIWERSFAASGSVSVEAVELLRPYAASLKASSAAASASAASATPSTATATAPSSSSTSSASDHTPDTIPSVHAHLGPLFGTVAKLVGLTLQQTAYVFMLSHVKALVSAAVRASVFGPYQAQKVLAGRAVQDVITDAIRREWDTPIEEAGQTMPMMDLWIGRHEALYSRIFNS